MKEKRGKLIFDENIIEELNKGITQNMMLDEMELMGIELSACLSESTEHFSKFERLSLLRALSSVHQANIEITKLIERRAHG